MLDKQRPDRMLLAVVMSLALSSAAGAGGGEACLIGKLQHGTWSSKASEESTGRDLRNYPPDRVVDYLHMTLQMRFDDLDEKRFTATETLRFAPIGRPAESFTLNAVGFQIESVTLDGHALEYFYDDKHLTLRFEPPLAPDRPREVVIEYARVDPGQGMIFTPSSSEVSDYAAQVHTTGQSATTASGPCGTGSRTSRTSTTWSCWSSGSSTGSRFPTPECRCTCGCRPVSATR
jgi:hypothetical protein